MRISLRNWAALVMSVFLATGAFAQTSLAPAGVPGEVVYIPFPLTIPLNGSLDPWKNIPLQTVTTGPAVSKNPAENGSLRFALAADAKYLYVLMLSTDVNLITGKHGPDTWNEDSLEFYINSGTNFWSKKYDKNVVQFRVLPSDIGNNDTSAVNLSGQNTGVFPTKAKVFRTADGWGFEAALDISGKLTPSHGREIGVQFQANGASVKDRDVKLIWSTADKGDNSWQNPSLFGRGIFFQIGKTDLPMPSTEPVLAELVPVVISQPVRLSLNQVGYFPAGPKTAVLAQAGSAPLPWSLIDQATKTVVAQGLTSAGRLDSVSGDTIHEADFSAFNQEGSYTIDIGGVQSSVFKIERNWTKGLARDALLYFYRTRSGMALAPEVAGQRWARPAGHLSDGQITAWDSGYKGVVNGSGGWYDAGDFGKYVVNGGISVWTLQNAFERMAPATEKGLPGWLDESRWEMEFLLNMQIPDGSPLAGLVFHKLHDRNWSGVPSALPETMDNNNGNPGSSRGRFVYEPSTAATLNLAATAAQAARLWKAQDPAFAARCLEAAQRAWKAAKAHPDKIAGNVPGAGGGNYDDPTVADDFYWAASELAITTGNSEYVTFVRSSPYFTQVGGISWGDTGPLGTLSLISAPATLTAKDQAQLKQAVLTAADRYLALVQAQGYRVPLDETGYVWGSNSVVLNNAIVLAVAYDLTRKVAYRDAVVHAMDYLLGTNALRKSFVTGYGSDPVSHPHHRVWGNDPDFGYPAPPPGVVAGGPNASIQDPEMESANLKSLPTAKRYLDKIGSYATNEVAINWNAPLAWVARWLDQQF